jgi:hypothetical protein
MTSDLQYMPNKNKKVSDFIVEFYCNVTRGPFSTGDLEISGVRRFTSKRLQELKCFERKNSQEVWGGGG